MGRFCWITNPAEGICRRKFVRWKNAEIQRKLENKREYFSSELRSFLEKASIESVYNSVKPREKEIDPLTAQGNRGSRSRKLESANRGRNTIGEDFPSCLSVGQVTVFCCIQSEAVLNYKQINGFERKERSAGR